MAGKKAKKNEGKLTEERRKTPRRKVYYRFDDEQAFLRILSNYNVKVGDEFKTQGSFSELQGELHAQFASVRNQAGKGLRKPTRAEIAKQLSSIKRKFRSATGKTLMIGIPEQIDFAEFLDWAKDD